MERPKEIGVSFERAVTYDDLLPDLGIPNYIRWS